MTSSITTHPNPKFLNFLSQQSTLFDIIYLDEQHPDPLTDHQSTPKKEEYLIPWSSLHGFCLTLGIPLRTFQEHLEMGQLRPNSLGYLHHRHAEHISPMMGTIEMILSHQQNSRRPVFDLASIKTIRSIGLWLFHPHTSLENKMPIQSICHKNDMSVMLDILKNQYMSKTFF